MQRALQHARDYTAHSPGRPAEALWIRDDLERPAWVTSPVLAHACLLASDWDAAHHLAAQGKVLGWSSGESAQGLVISAYLVLLSGKAPGTLSSNLKQLWQWALQNSIAAWGWAGEQENPMYKRLELVYAEHLAHAQWIAERQKRFLDWCLDVAQRRVNAIVGDKHRGSYDKAAVLTVACAEVLRLRGDKAAADALIGEIRDRFSRYRAFQAEMKTALRQTERGL